MIVCGVSAYALAPVFSVYSNFIYTLIKVNFILELFLETNFLSFLLGNIFGVIILCLSLSDISIFIHI